MSAYTKYSFLYPPRPEKAISPKQLKWYQNKGWVGQFKKNGTCTVLSVSPDKDITVRTRRDTPHKAWSPTDGVLDPFTKLPGKGWYVFMCEVLHSKTSRVKNTIYIFDIAVNDGELLLGTTFTERQEILRKMFPSNVETISHYLITEKVWLAKTIEGGFADMMKRIQEKSDREEGNSEDEGLVIKRPDAKLASLGRAKSNGAWQVKCRVGQKNYAF